MNNIVLIGFMGTGKSSVAKALEREYGYRLVDTDERIALIEGMSIAEIFKKKGEEGFRRLETELIKNELMGLSGVVISCGGGMPLKKENRKLLKSVGTVIWLKASAQEILKRLAGDTKRPLLACDNREAMVLSLMEERSPLYAEAANFEVVTDEKTPSQIAREIVGIVKNLSAHIGY